MDAQYWHQKWDGDQIGFHQSEVNKPLLDFWPTLAARANQSSESVKSCVFVPLCGKSLDMHWLHQQGHAVLGIELSDKAAQAFFTENSLSYERRNDGDFVRYSGTGKAQGIAILTGDFFKLTPAHTASCALFYDRAALIAMHPDMRADYTEQLAMLMSTGSQGLLQTLSYDQTRMKGPPFSVSDETVNQFLAKSFKVEEIAHYGGPERLGSLAARGLENLDERVYLLHRKP